MLFILLIDLLSTGTHRLELVLCFYGKDHFKHTSANNVRPSVSGVGVAIAIPVPSSQRVSGAKSQSVSANVLLWRTHCQRREKCAQD